jgi:ribonucleotide reductase beta subunit family protein with ferritin-like domain/thymidine kinase
MFGGKTTEIARFMGIEGRGCVPVYINSSKDSRSDKAFSTHSPTLDINPVDFTMFKVLKLADVPVEVWKTHSTFFIDEANFFEDVVPTIRSLVNVHGKRVYVAGLASSFAGDHFGKIWDLAPQADSIKLLRDVMCRICLAASPQVRKTAIFSMLLKGDRTVKEQVGGDDMYAPVCRDCFYTAQDAPLDEDYLAYDSGEDELSGLDAPSEAAPEEEEDLEYAKYSFNPVRFPVLKELWERQNAIFWPASHVKHDHRDLLDWAGLDPGVRALATRLLVLFKPLDGIVGENIQSNFLSELGALSKDVIPCLTAALHQEVVHNQTYSELFDLYLSATEKRIPLLKTLPSLRKVMSWVVTHTNPSLPLHERMVAMAALEGILFTSGFEAIGWIKSRNVLPALTSANEFIRRDENIHAEQNVIIYFHLTTPAPKGFGTHEPLPHSRIFEIIGSAVDVSLALTRDVIPEGIALIPEDMCEYVKCVADGLAVSLGCSKIYGARNPFPDNVMMTVPSRTNFFERASVTEYANDTSKEALELWRKDVEF